MNTVTVLIEGYIKAIEGRQLIPGVSADGARHVAGTVVLIRGENVVIVADPGMVTDRALIVAALTKEGVSPHEVTHVFVSHHHPDHTVNIALFPNAAVVDFWAVYKGDLWRDHADGYAIAPGITDTAQPRYGMSEEELQAAGRQVPLGRMGTPEDVADLAVFLASEESRHITGQTIHVNGGQYLY